MIDEATQQNPEMRIVTAGQAVKAMVLNGLGFVNQQLYLVPHFFQNKPTHRLIAPGISSAHLNDDTLGRALDTLYAYGVTPLYSLIATTAAQRLGLAPWLTHLDSTSFHVDGRYKREEATNQEESGAEESEAEVVQLTRGYSRDHRPDLNQVMLELIVDHQAGIPLLMKPLDGNSNDTRAFGQVIKDHIAQLQTTYGTTYLVADCALYSAANLTNLAETQLKWITRVPATLHEAQTALAQAEPQTMTPLADGYRYQTVSSTYGGVAQRWLLIYSEQRHGHAQRAVEKQWLKQSTQELTAFKKLTRRAFACEADAQQALSRFEQGLQATAVSASHLCPIARYRQRRPGKAAQPAQVVYQIDGALASSLPEREARVLPQSCFLLATNELDEACLAPQDVLAAYKGQGQAERGFRFLKDPQFLAAALFLKKPERIMALLMVMTVCLLVYAALEYRIRHALKDQGATFPNQKGKPVQNPTARWVFHYFVGIHLLYPPGEWPIVLNLTEIHQQLLQLLGKRYQWFYR